MLFVNRIRRREHLNLRKPKQVKNLSYNKEKFNLEGA